MFINGVLSYTKDGQKQATGLLAGRAAKDGEMLSTRSGKKVGSVSVPAYNRQDGTTAWLTVKGWGHWADVVASARKGDSIFAMGRIDSRDYNGRTYSDLAADYVCISRDTADHPSQFPGVNVSAADFEEVADDDGDIPF